MGDSDDEYDRRRARDKFRRERSDYQERRDDRNRREDFAESRDRSGRRDYRDYDPRSRRDRYSPPRHDLSPPIKRMRRDWDDRGGYGSYGYDMGYPPSGGGGGGGMIGGPHSHWGGSSMAQDMNMMHGSHGEPEAGLTQPPMKTFKAFLGMQDDTIDDQEAVKKYNEYKQDFRKSQISEFFINHKEEEWFKTKYHPEECSKKRTEQLEALQKRLNIFMELLSTGWMEPVTIDVDKSDQIIRLLDAVVIKLEGGDDNDLKALDEPIEEEKPKDNPPLPSLTTATVITSASSLAPDGETSKDENSRKSNNINSDLNLEEGRLKEVSKKKSAKKGSDDSDNEDSDGESSSSSSSESDSEDDEDDEKDGEGSKRERRMQKKAGMKDALAKEEASRRGDNEDEDAAKVKSSTVHLKPESEEMENKAQKDDDSEADEEESKPEKDVTEGEKNPAAAGPADDENAAEDSTKDGGSGLSKPRPLHRTCSIFLRNLAPTITQQEVESICKRFNGFLRVAIADPQPERRFFRRGWVTFERTENIKDTCWNLNNIRLRDCELGAIVNRDLSRRIRSVNGITAHKQVVRSDIKLAARIIQNLDSQREVWAVSEQKESDVLMFGLGSKNPLLKNITDYLIEEASAEEEELLGVFASIDSENKEGEDAIANTLERDEILIKVLDRLLLYLRIVHSVDYYNQSEYPNEDEMPNRCGIMHARGPAPTSKVTQNELTEYIQTFEQKISSFLQPSVKLTDEDADKLGRKDQESEVEKFIQANSQELAKNKWLCPLSGKKFQGPEFIRKHIFNKHGEKVEEVRKEVQYFNNYLQDSKRPQLPEHPLNRQQQQSGAAGGPRGDMMMPYPGGGTFPASGPPFPGGPGGFRGPPPGFMPGFGGRSSFPDMYNRPGNFNKRSSYGRNPRVERKVITYRDLDAPTENDFF